MHDPSSPLLSIVIPTRNRLADLRLCLESLSRAQVPQMECIIIDDASTVRIADILKDILLETTLIRLDIQSGSAVARNIGSGTARGEILLFVDDDVCVQPDSLANIVTAFRNDPGLGAVIGRYDDSPSNPHFISQFRNLLHAYTHQVSAGAASTFWTGFGAVRASIFRDYGGFTEESLAIDDVEFGTRLSRSGVHIELRPDLQVKHLKCWTLKSMLITDLMRRGIPWTLLLWRERSMPNTLNLRRNNRLSVALACFAVVLAAAAVAGRIYWVFAEATVAAVLLLNLKFYAFLRRRHGNRFAIGSAAAHWLYLWTAGFSFGMGTAIFIARSLRNPKPVESGVIDTASEPAEAFPETS